jgi:rhodanese-related sulfurtransferase
MPESLFSSQIAEVKSPHVSTQCHRPGQNHAPLGTPKCPTLIDVRMPDEIEGQLFPAAISLQGADVAAWGAAYAGKEVIVICRNGQAVSPGVAAWLRHYGADAQILEDGILGWQAAKFPLLNGEALPARDAQGRTHWVTRARPKVDRIACPWLIRRFIDPGAVFLFASPSEIQAVSLALRTPGIKGATDRPVAPD